MSKLKKAIITVLLSLLTVMPCVSVAACGNNERADESGDNKSSVGYENGTPYGLYTDLQFSLNGENGLVSASVKNRFTLFPSTVTVNVELYRSDAYQESVENMTLAASNSIHDLDQGKTVTASASTDGKKSYWKARTRYKIDNKSWKEKFSETVYMDENGIKTDAPAPVPDDREYYISDFLQDYKTAIAFVKLPLPEDWEDRYLISAEASGTIFKSKEQFNTVKDLFGEIKLNPYKESFMETQLKHGVYIMYGFLSFSIATELSDGSKVYLYIDDTFKDFWQANLFVHYYKEENGKTLFSKYLTAIVSDETKQALIDYTIKVYEENHNINSSASEWVEFTDLMEGKVLSANVDMLINMRHYNAEDKLIPERRLEFKVKEEGVSSIKQAINPIKITQFDMEMNLSGSKASGWFNSACKLAEYSLIVNFDNNKSIKIYKHESYKRSFGINLYVVYNDGETTVNYTGLIDDETYKTLKELTVNIYEKQFRDSLMNALNQI